jgi:single-strand selective monofunctional uracil DNA glycosylase
MPAAHGELVRALIREWRENARRWESVARDARAAGLEVWNPARYAARTHTEFLRRFPPRRGALLALGLNPGPYGMAQTGIPFTDCRTARSELGLELELPGCAPADLAGRLRKETGRWRGTYERSSLGVYAFLHQAWGGLERAYANWFVGNPCPLLFLEPGGWNVTPAHPKLRRIVGMQELREIAVERFAAALKPRAIVCLGQDVAKAVEAVGERLVGRERYLRYPHPARAVPKRWAQGLVAMLRRKRLL